MNTRSVFLAGIVALFVSLFSGCASVAPAGAYNGNDTLYKADVAITTGYDVLHSFVTWEYQNRAILADKPGVTAAADNVRKNAPLWISSAIALRDAYAAAPTTDNQKALQSALAVIQAALLEATKYLSAPPPAMTPVASASP